MDFVYLGLIALFFALCQGLARACDKLGGTP